MDVDQYLQYAAAYRRAHPSDPDLEKERRLEYQRQYNATHREQQREQQREYRAANPHVIRESRRQYNLKHRESCLENMRKYRASHQKEALAYREQHRETYRERSRQWRANPANRERVRLRHTERYNTDDEYRMKCNLRSRLHRAIKRNAKSASTLELLGCTVPELIAHLESQLPDGANLRDYQIDHIRPCASFDLTDPAQQRECFGWRNLQPLTPSANLSKGAKWSPPLIPTSG